MSRSSDVNFLRFQLYLFGISGLEAIHQTFPFLECPYDDCINFVRSKPRYEKCRLHYRSLTLLFPYHPLRDYYDLTCDEYQQTQQEQPKKLILSKLVNNLWTKLKKGLKENTPRKLCQSKNY
jgi:hypothetical protein